MALDRDAYFTPLSDCEEIIETVLKDHPELKSLKWVEPSAGCGNFVKAAEKLDIKNIEAYDLHPMGEGIIKNDFLDEPLNLKGSFVFGNPPYGRRSRLALDFIDRSFSQGAEYVGFLLMGGFISYSNISKIKSKCDLVSLRSYSIKFEDQNGDKISSNILNDFDFIFVVFKKSDCKIKDLIFNNSYEVTLDKNNFDFSTGYKRFFSRDETPELGGKDFKTSFYIKEFENIGRKPTLRLYKNKNYDEEFVKYFSSLILDGKPSVNTLNFYSTYKHILKDLV